MTTPNNSPPEPMSEEEIHSVWKLLVIKGMPGHADHISALLCEGNENRKRIANVVESLEDYVNHCCRENCGKQFCESYGCSTLAEIIKQLKGEA